MTFDFRGLDYSLEERSPVLRWRQSNGDWESSGMPTALAADLKGVCEFRFRPRAPGVRFTEDDCLDSFGYRVEEDWAECVPTFARNQKSEHHWLTADDLISGAVLVVQAERGNADVLAEPAHVVGLILSFTPNQS